ncbi:MAG TPA: SusC/RagA family TonB-linked outer membrane protein [Gemmatimonadaceae bacterium]|nr:SusC/RagA family TonB-linked outer membrane protein [Gemmatimonadaceae bacterium]
MRQLRRFLAVACAVLGLPALAFAQQTATITGQVTSVGGLPLASAQVYLVGMNIGGLTQSDGTYSLTVPAAQATGQQATITARLIGYKQDSARITLAAGHITQDFRLTSSPVQLQEVVVTALGQVQKKSQLGTAVQEVSSEQLNSTHAQNVINQLDGKVAGVTITGAGTQGGSTHIVIRGSNSVNGDNQPLFIVDGVPASNTDILGGGSANGGHDFGSVISDLNPDDIATITVLKGPNAAALYGSRAANGVVLITTKHGAATGGQIQTQLSTSLTWDKPSILPKYQNEYGQGAGGMFKFVDGAGGGIQDFNDQSYGPRLSGQLIDQFTGAQQPWVAHPNNVYSYFNTGQTFDGTLAFSGGTDRANARISLGAQNVNGYIPNNTFRKLTGSLSGAVKVGQHLSANANIQVINNKGHNQPGVGYNTGVLEQFIWFGRQVDLAPLKARQYQADGSLFNWNYNFHNNPYYLQYDNPITTDRNNVIASASATWQFNDWLNASLVSGVNSWNEPVNENFAQGNINYADPNYDGGFNLYQLSNTEQNSRLTLNADRDLTSRLALNASAGAARDYSEYSEKSQRTAGISVPGIYNVSNAAITPTLGQDLRRQQINSVYGSASLTWDNWWTVEGTARNDWSSTLPKATNSYFYPSFNTSIILTNALPGLKSNVLSYLKLRGGIARVGAAADPYSLLTTYNGQSDKFGSLPQYTLSNNIANANLKPELTTSTEVGAEMEFFNGRGSLDMSWYNKSTKNQVINLTVAPSSGFSQTAINAGEIQNKGIEALVTVVPVQLASGFQWTSTFNFARNKSKVVSLYRGLDRYRLGGAWSLDNEARVGESYGDLYGYALRRDSATGELLLRGGLPQKAKTRTVLGNIQPDWVGGWNNEFRYKNVSLSALLDIHRGGSVFSISNMFGQYSGVFRETLRGRENDWDDPGIVLKGIDQSTGAANATRVTAEQYFQSLFEIHEPFIYDDSYIKLRELRVGFNFPQRWAGYLHASSASIAFVGRNLWTHTKLPNIDPEFSYTTGNVQGMEFAALPNPKSFGVNLRITP